MAVRRRTTLKEVVTHALERELYWGDQASQTVSSIDEEGLPCLRPRGARVTSELVNRLLDEEHG